MEAYTYPDVTPAEWTRRITRAAERFRRGDVDHTLCSAAFGGDVALYVEVMRRIVTGTATPAMFVPFRSHTPARRG